MVKISIPRKTPEDDMERLAENLWNEYGDKIEDVDSFNLYYDKYLTNDYTTDLTKAQDTTLRKKVFDAIKEKHKSVLRERVIRRGKPREKFPKVNGKTMIDGDREARILKISKKPKYIYLRYVKNKVVYARKEILKFTIKGKKYRKIIYRERYGRFTSGESLRKRKKVKISKVI